MNPITALIGTIHATLDSLPPPLQESAEKRIFQWIGHDINSGKVTASVDIDWFRRIAYTTCAEQWWTRWLCQLAHGNQCGSEEYVALKNRVLEADKKIRSMVKESGLDNGRRLRFKAQITRDYISFSYQFKLVMEDSHLPAHLRLASQELLSNHPRRRRWYKEEMSTVFLEYRNLLSQEFGEIIAFIDT